MDKNDELFKGTSFADLIKEYLDVAVKNDDHLVKLTAIVQRFISTKQTIAGADGLLSDEEKQQLLKVAEATLSAELEDEIDRISEEEQVLQQKIETAKSKLDKEA